MKLLEWLGLQQGGAVSAAPKRKHRETFKVSVAGGEQSFEVEKGRKVILNAALSAGLGFPHNCRVGSCTQCKCTLKSGKVRELTDSSYVLSAEDLKAGMILACQSIPETDLEIEVNLTSGGDRLVETRGTIVGQKNLTHDIVELRVALDDAMPMKAGQYAELRLEELSLSRNYSFAVAPKGQELNELVFHIRKVPGGRFTEWLFEANRQETRLSVSGPFGDFYLRAPEGEKPAPIVCVAGGSGMAPILSLLDQAKWAGETRDAYYLFGARTQRDLYAADEIARIQQGWRGSLNFTQVLSEEAANSGWEGPRGYVTDALNKLNLDWPRVQAYLCGPPAMIDAAIARFSALGVKPEHIHYDKFE
ncbi:2Fe-2S iron-sulfur cluster-binding protein [Limnobacter humi]|uniref:2Fe-2S iron-sulfur cluster-binding protein n=1 Tax=Limnobacter humi TaxID=1778671 RepID=A0ABT1WJ05_9BURK|nr:2Fe-2S iron-sulfur cluster-binding protein [Limnobacter humi]MCQ8897492.1 2Fe-2S iron-sulfur cluster-binding protein [Limnobacter humi]